MAALNKFRHPREGGGPTPELEGRNWIPAFAGMTMGWVS
jgi:hypothetical protein